MITRRRFSALTLAAMGACSATGFALAQGSLHGLSETLKKLEEDTGGRLGVGVIDAQSNASGGYRADELFPMCSTFKILCAAAVLARSDAGHEQLTRRISIADGDLLEYAPVTKQHAGGEMTVAELCEAMVTLSDNTAANLLLRAMGGPNAITQLARTIGDKISRLDRFEPDLNSAIEGDSRDTTTPMAMAQSVRTLTTGSSLSPASREKLNAWLIGCKTGDSRLRGGLPKDWTVGDKTGTGENGTSNDAAVAWPPGRAPIIITAYLTNSKATADQRKATFAAISRAVVEALGS